MIDISIILPVYNEEKAIVFTINEIHKEMSQTKHEYEIIVVDDKSTDKTIEALNACSDVRIIQREKRGGSGAARKAGILKAKGEIIVMIDGDGSYSSGDIPKLIAFFPEYDQVNGKRVNETGKLRLLRIIIKWFLKKMASYLAGSDIPDLNTGMKAFKKEIMKKFLWLIPDGFSCVSTMTMAFLCNGYKVKWIPTLYRKRIGESKFNLVTDTYNYFLTIVKIIMYFDPLKIFMPAGSFLFFSGLIKSVMDIFWGYFQKTTYINITFLLTGVMLWVLGLLADIIVAHGRANLRLAKDV